MHDDQFDRLVHALERIATALESGALAQPQQGGGSNSRPVNECVKQPDGRFKWTIPPETKPSKCKRCGGEIYWMRSKNHKNVPAEVDGYGHMDRCNQAGNPATTGGPPSGSDSFGSSSPPF